MLALAAVVVSAEVGVAQAPSPAWRLILAAPNDTRFEIDQRSVEVRGTRRFVWLRRHQPDILDSGSLSVERREVDCANRQSRTLATKTYALDPAGRARLTDSVLVTPPPPWLRGGPGSIEAQLVNAICRSPNAVA